MATSSPPVLHLFLSHREAWNSSYSLEDGQVLYKAVSPFTFIGRKIDISKAIPAPLNDPHGGLRDQFTHMAHIQMNSITPSVFKYDGMEVPENRMFRKAGWDWHGRNRIFRGPDGVEYAWRLCSHKCKLVLKASPKVVVANFHRKQHGIFHEKRLASLDIYPPGQHIVDLIVMTYIYVEKLRQQREDAQHHGGGD